MQQTNATTNAANHENHDDHYECARAWVALQTVHTMVTECLGSALATCCDLTINDFEVLVRLQSAEPERLRLTDLNRAVALSQPALSRLVARLEHDGLVERGHAPDDGRAILLSLTDTGHDTLRRAAPLHAACVRDILTSRLSDAEQRFLVESLTRVGDG